MSKRVITATKSRRPGLKVEAEGLGGDEVIGEGQCATSPPQLGGH